MREIKEVFMKVKRWSSHLVKAIIKFKWSLITSLILLLLVVFFAWICKVRMDNPFLAVFSGGIASIIATIVCRMFDAVELSILAHKEMVRAAEDFCYYALDALPKEEVLVSDYVAELRSMVVAMRRYYPDLLDKAHYNRLTVAMHQATKKNDLATLEDNIMSSVAEIRKYIEDFD